MSKVNQGNISLEEINFPQYPEKDAENAADLITSIEEATAFNNMKELFEKLPTRLRPDVLRFAGFMEAQMSLNEQTKGESWKEKDLDSLLNSLVVYTEKLHMELVKGLDKENNINILTKCADVANFSMFIATKVHEKEYEF